MTGNTKSSWGTIARCFHWILGLAIIGMIAYGWWMNHFPARADRFFYRSIHADIGYLVLLLDGDPPDLAQHQSDAGFARRHAALAAIAARISHWALYLVTVLVAMLGWAIPAHVRQIRTMRASSAGSTCRSSPRPTRSRPAPMRTGTFSSPMCCWR